MGLDYVRIRDQVVQKQIRENGKAGTLLATGPATSGQPDWNPQPGADIEQSVYVVETKLMAKDIDGKVVLATDSAFLVSPEGATTLTPKVNQRLRIDGEIWQVIKVGRTKPGSITMFWKVFARK